MIFVNANDVLMSEATSKEKVDNGCNVQNIAVRQSEIGNALSQSSNREVNTASSGRESVTSDPGYISSSSCDRSRLPSIEEDHNANEYNAVISPCNTSICDVLNDTFIASNLNSPISEAESTIENSSDVTQTLPEEANETNFENSLRERAKDIPVGSLLHSQDTYSKNLPSMTEDGSYYDQRIDFDMFFDGVLETTYSDLVANHNVSSIFANNATSAAPPSGISNEASQNCPQELQLSPDDFTLDNEMPFNLHGTCQTLPSLMEFSRNEMTLQSQLCNNNVHFMTYQEEEFSNRNGRAEMQIFAKTSPAKHGNAVSSSVSDNKAVPTTEDEAWRSYLENPLTAATTAMMSIHGDEDSAAALGMLYDYYKVPKEKRLLSYPASIADLKNRSAITQNVGANITQDVTSNRHKDDLPPTVLPPISSAKPVESLPPRGVPDDKNQRLDTVGDVIIQQRATIGPDTIVKRELAQPTCNAPKNFSTKPLPSISYSPSAKSSFVPAATIDFTALSTQSSNSYVIAKEINDNTRDPMEYVMEAPKSLKQKEDDPTMSYINKGQFYGITLRSTDVQKLNGTRMKSVIHIVFGDQKSEEEQLRHWKYWHARQHTVKQRIIDIADYKESNMIYDVEEIAHNAVAFCWNANETAKIFVSCNCLSTDFSAQKGIKGLPLLLQIDSFIDGQDVPFHRAQCQIKVFCDKGAERKIRDEERKASRKRQKNSKSSKSSPSGSNLLPLAELKPTPSTGNQPQSGPQPLRRLDFVKFKATKDIDTRPVLFIPEHTGHSSVSHPVVTSSITPSATTTTPLSPKATAPVVVTEKEQPFVVLPESSDRSTMKRQHTNDDDNTTSRKIPRYNEHERVLLYVRQPTEEVYDGLVLETPSLVGLKLSIQEKFGYPSEHIKNIFKKSKRGILVRMDDNIIRHYSNEDTFIIEIRSEAVSDATKHTITLTEV